MDTPSGGASRFAAGERHHVAAIVDLHGCVDSSAATRYLVRPPNNLGECTDAEGVEQCPRDIVLHFR